MNQDKELKLMLTDMLAWFHDFCEKNNLRYYVLGGTMLGAARHKGFIPWDDDIDVGMPRKDYEKFAKIMKNSSSRYVFERLEDNAKDFFYAFGKIYDTETTLIENLKVKAKRGIYIDVFPLDGVANTVEDGIKYAKKIHSIDNLLMLKVANWRKNRSLIKNLGVVLFKFIPINPKRILNKLNERCCERDFDDYDIIANLLGAWRLKEMMPKSYLGSPTLYKFENLNIYGPEKYDEYLTSLYGDWKKLPPKEKQVSHHDYLLMDLHKSYLD